MSKSPKMGRDVEMEVAKLLIGISAIASRSGKKAKRVQWGPKDIALWLIENCSLKISPEMFQVAEADFLAAEADSRYDEIQEALDTLVKQGKLIREDSILGPVYTSNKS